MIIMKIIDIVKNNTLMLSFEVFPPKTETAFESVKTATEEIAKLHPSFMSVTYGAGGGTSQYTLDIAKNIKDTYGVPTLAHLTCVSSTNRGCVMTASFIDFLLILNVIDHFYVFQKPYSPRFFVQLLLGFPSR